jgi:hypothetical protein
MRSRTVVSIGLGCLATGVAVFACAPPPQPKPWTNDFKGPSDDVFLTDADLTCLGDAKWTRVGKTFVWNAANHQEQALAVARSKAPGEYPVGTVLQLIPGEASVKRAKGFSPETNDWEFLQIGFNQGKAVIVDRGTTEPHNAGGTCLSCHGPAKDYDLACFTNDHCKGFPFFVPLFINLNIDPAKDDPRCHS